MTAPPPHISITTKLASALLALGHVPYEDAKMMSAAQVNSLFAFDHYPIRHADGGPSEPWNLVPRLIMAHRVKTAKVDAPAMAKDRDIARANEESRRRILAKEPGRSGRPPSKWPKRSLKSRNTLRRS